MSASQKKKAKFTPDDKLRQTEIDSYIPWGSKSRCQQAFDFQMMLTIIKNNWSFKEVQKEGTVELVAFLMPQARIRDESTYRKNKLPLVYNQLQEAVGKLITKDLPNAGDVSFTADFWKSRSLDMYLNMSLHYISKSGRLRNFCIGFTGNKIWNIFNNVLTMSKFHLQL